MSDMHENTFEHSGFEYKPIELDSREREKTTVFVNFLASDQKLIYASSPFVFIEILLLLTFKSSRINF